MHVLKLCVYMLTTCIQNEVTEKPVRECVKWCFRWPDIYKKVKKKMPNGQWKETCMFGHHIIHQTRRLIKSISKSCYRIETEVSEDVYSEEFAPLIENELGLLLCIFELEKMIKGEFRLALLILLLCYWNLFLCNTFLQWWGLDYEVLWTKGSPVFEA